MTIVTAQLVTTNSLQEALVSKAGMPLSGGIVTCYKDNARTTLKNWYYQSGNTGPYTYIALPNPLTLSAAGTICDANGVDVLPFFYPYAEDNSSLSEPYFIRVTDSNATTQFTRSNFPLPLGDGAPPVTSDAAAENYIINNVFWRNFVGPIDLSSATTNVEVCPAQNNGFKTPNITFVKSGTGATDSCTFLSFGDFAEQPLTDDPTPEYYINHTCSAGTTSESFKYYQFPISLHINTLAGLSGVVSYQCQWISGGNEIQAAIYQDTGTGGEPLNILWIDTFDGADSDWQKHEFTVDIPPSETYIIGSEGDDATYLLLQVPLNTVCSINITKPSFYLTSVAPTNSFQTYSQIDAVINTLTFGSTTNIQYLTGSGTYTPTVGTTSILVEATAGGGGGGAVVCPSGSFVAGRGGAGGGGAVASKFYSVVPSSAAYVVGAGGTAGTTTGQAGTGGSTIFNTIASTATAGSTTTLTSSSTQIQYFTGTTTQTVLLPVTSTLTLGQYFGIVNNSTGAVTVQSSGANTLQVMAANTQLIATVILTSGTSTASWSWTYGAQTTATASVNIAGGAGGYGVTATSGSPLGGSGAGGVADTSDSSNLVYPGGIGIILANGVTGTISNGGSSGTGSPGAATASSTTGITATGYGGGASGAYASSSQGITYNGGVGAPGALVITEYISAIVSQSI